MATDEQLIIALESATVRVIGRKITPAERGKLIEKFNESKATTTFVRAQEAIVNFSCITESELVKKAAASDDTNRAIQDLRDIANNWKK